MFILNITSTLLPRWVILFKTTTLFSGKMNFKNLSNKKPGAPVTWIILAMRKKQKKNIFSNCNIFFRPPFLHGAVRSQRNAGISKTSVIYNV